MTTQVKQTETMQMAPLVLSQAISALRLTYEEIRLTMTLGNATSYLKDTRVGNLVEIYGSDVTSQIRHDVVLA